MSKAVRAGNTIFEEIPDKISSLKSPRFVATRHVAMLHRAASPALSENEFDITKSLFRDDPVADDDEFNTTLAHGGALDAGRILDLGLESNGDDDDAFIAAQQTASNRKASNLKGKSVKKGGGFQAMGTQL